MDLGELTASRFLAGAEESLLNLKAAVSVHSVVQSEALTEPLLAAFFWQIFKSSTIYTQALQTLQASPLAAQQSETIVVPRGSPYNARFDLVVLDPGYSRGEPASAYLEDLERGDLSGVVERWKAATIGKLRERPIAGDRRRHLEDFERSLQLISAIDPLFPKEAMAAKRFGIVVARQPLLHATAVPSPYWGLAAPGGNPVSTVGAVVTNTMGRNGVTVALHSLLAIVPSVVPGSTSVEIDAGGSRMVGTVQSIDSVTDSAFVQVSHPLPIPAPLGARGPLRGVCPRVNEQVSYEGLGSGHANATVTGFTPDLPLVLTFSQLKLFTTAVTSPGDSGAALLDGDDHILGFSFYRTGIGQAIEFSAWIWADSVYAAHSLV